MLPTFKKCCRLFKNVADYLKMLPTIQKCSIPGYNALQWAVAVPEERIHKIKIPLSQIGQFPLKIDIIIIHHA